MTPLNTIKVHLQQRQEHVWGPSKRCDGFKEQPPVATWTLDTIALVIGEAVRILLQMEGMTTEGNLTSAHITAEVGQPVVLFVRRSQTRIRIELGPVASLSRELRAYIAVAQRWDLHRRHAA